MSKTKLSNSAKAQAEDDIDINAWTEDGINLIPSILGRIARLMSVPEGEDVGDYAERLSIRCTELQESGDRNTLLTELRDTDMVYANLYLGLELGDTALAEGNPYIALSFILRAIHGYTMIPDWRSAAKSKHGAQRAARASHAPHNANKQKARDWYADHKAMTKDAAAEKMAKDGIVHASFRTIRGYLSGQ